MNRNLIVAAFVIAALAIVAFFVLRGGRGRADEDGAAATAGGDAATATPTSPRAGSAPATGSGRAPSAPERVDDAGPEGRPFQRARSRAMASLQSDLSQRIAVCAPPSSTPPRPRPIRLALEWRPEASTPEMQQYMVKEVTLIGGNADAIPPAIRACIDQLRGMPVPVFVDPGAIAPEDRTMDETFEIPLP